MERAKSRIYRLDGDELETLFHFDNDSQLWIEDYVDFESTPRYTPGGRPWKSVTTTDCPYADPEYGDCGTCPWLIKETPTDLIGVCDHLLLRQKCTISKIKQLE